MVDNLHLGDIVSLRKPHPCGSYQWQIVRLGLDIGLVCKGCSRRILIPRSKLARQIKNIIARPEGDEDSGD